VLICTLGTLLIIIFSSNDLHPPNICIILQLKTYQKPIKSIGKLYSRVDLSIFSSNYYYATVNIHLYPASNYVNFYCPALHLLQKSKTHTYTTWCCQHNVSIITKSG